MSGPKNRPVHGKDLDVRLLDALIPKDCNPKQQIVTTTSNLGIQGLPSNPKCDISG